MLHIWYSVTTRVYSRNTASILLALVREVGEVGQVLHRHLRLTPSPLPYRRRRVVHLRARVLVTEVRRVRFAAQTRFPRRRNPLLLQRFPINAGKKRVDFDLLLTPRHRLHLLRVGWTRPQSEFGIALQQQRDEIASLEREEGLRVNSSLLTHRESQLAVKDLAEHHLAVLVVEGRLRLSSDPHTYEACDHLVQQRAHRPPVHCPVVWVSCQHLGRHVLGRACVSSSHHTHTADGFGFGVGRVVLLGEPEVSDDDMPVAVQQDVLRLHVPIL